jgi:hypothetical protein
MNPTKVRAYKRVCPRDLFNEAKLLKCMGRLCLKILDGMTPVPMKYNDDHVRGFNVEQDEAGNLYISNLPIYIKGKRYKFHTTYNCKSNYPLFVETANYEEFEVFDNDGDFTQEFIDFTKTI